MFAGQSADFIAMQCIARANPNSNNIPSRNASDIQLLQCFINDYRVAKAVGCSSGEHIEPAWCDDADAEGPVTRIDEVNFRRSPRHSSFYPYTHDSNEAEPNPRQSESSESLFKCYDET